MITVEAFDKIVEAGLELRPRSCRNAFCRGKKSSCAIGVVVFGYLGSKMATAPGVRPLFSPAFEQVIGITDRALTSDFEHLNDTSGRKVALKAIRDYVIEHQGAS